MVEIPYEVAHNLIYSSIEFAGEAGIEPVDEWGITQYILEEDDDNVPLIEYQWGLNGMHYLLAEDIVIFLPCRNILHGSPEKMVKSLTEFCESERLEGTRTKRKIGF